MRTLLAEVVIPGNPKGKERPRTTMTQAGKMRTFTPRTTIGKQQEVGWAIKADMQERGFAGDPDELHAFEVIVRIHECRPAGHQVDGDNVLKLVLDALNGIAFQDDRQVTDMAVKICDRNARTPRTEITVYQLEELA